MLAELQLKALKIVDENKEGCLFVEYLLCTPMPI
jgi:hypothetical protein